MHQTGNLTSSCQELCQDWVRVLHTKFQQPPVECHRVDIQFSMPFFLQTGIVKVGSCTILERRVKMRDNLGDAWFPQYWISLYSPTQYPSMIHQGLYYKAISSFRTDYRAFVFPQACRHRRHHIRWFHHISFVTSSPSQIIRYQIVVSTYFQLQTIQRLKNQKSQKRPGPPFISHLFFTPAS